ncbi:MAG: hypothetical protein JO345_24830 [Streptosporangiaceae bacterium]|nr:hypothetical protein [Streptosporangiaceae bacterium]
MRKVMFVASVMLAAAGTVFAAGSPAHAAVDDAVCPVGSLSIAFNPALTSQPQNVAETAQSSYSCVTGADSAIDNSSMQLNGVSCVNLLTAFPPFTDTIGWIGGTGPATSQIQWTSTQGTLTTATTLGTVISGRFAGDSAQRVVANISLSGNNPLLCPLGLGTVSGLSGPATLTILHL